MTTTVDGIAGLKSVEGQHLGHSPWVQVTQEQVQQFADATGDHQWIHLDIERAKAESPFGGVVAHGYLTLSLAPALLPQIFTATGFAMGVNYGAEKIRFPSPVPVGSRLRMGATLAKVDEIDGAAQCAFDLIFQTEGATKPSCVATVVFRYYVG